MKKLIYSQEDVDLMISLEEQEYDEEIYNLKQEIEYLRSTGSLGILDKKCKELQNRVDLLKDINDKQKEVLDKIKEETKLAYNELQPGELVIGQALLKNILELLEEIK